MERDEALKKVQENVRVCECCRKVLGNATPRHDPSAAAETTLDVVSHDGDSPTTILPCSPDGIESTGLMMTREVQVASQRHHSVPETKSKFISHYRCLSRSPLRKDSGHTMNSKSECKAANMPVILVPETQLQVSISEGKALTTQTVCIPETLDIDCSSSSRSVDEEAPESRNLWDGKDKRCAETGYAVVEGLRTPTKPAALCNQAESPVLGRPNRPSGQTSIALAPLDVIDSPEAQKFGENKRDIRVTVIPETPTTTTITAVRPEHITPTPRYSPLVFSSASLNDSFDTSPSLLQAAKITSNTRPCSEVNRKAENHTHTSPEGKTWNEEPEAVKKSFNDSLTTKEFTGKKRRVLQRSVSSLNTTTTNSSSTTTKKRVLRKHLTSSDCDRLEGSVYKLTITSPGPQRKRTYKQTKISEVMFQRTKRMMRQTGIGMDRL